MTVRYISIPLTSSDLALGQPQRGDKIRSPFGEALHHEVERLFPEATVVVVCGYSEPEVTADSTEERQRACYAVWTAYNRVMGQGAWRQAAEAAPV